MQENTNLQGHGRVKMVLCVHFQYISNNRILGFKKAWRTVMLTGMGTKDVMCVFIVKWLGFQLLSCWLHTSLPSVIGRYPRLHCQALKRQYTASMNWENHLIANNSPRSRTMQLYLQRWDLEGTTFYCVLSYYTLWNSS